MVIYGSLSRKPSVQNSLGGTLGADNVYLTLAFDQYYDRSRHNSKLSAVIRAGSYSLLVHNMSSKCMCGFFRGLCKGQKGTSDHLSLPSSDNFFNHSHLALQLAVVVE